MGDDSSDFIDTGFEQITSHINGEPLFYTTTQVADKVGVDAPTIRYWTREFKDLLDVEISNRNRKYKKSDLAKLLFIKKLRYIDKLSMEQVKNYCQSKNFDMNSIEHAIIDGSNPIAIQAFTRAVMTEIDKKIDDKLNSFFEQFKELQNEALNLQQDISNKMQQEIVVTVEEVVSEKLNEQQKKYEEKIDKLEKKATEKDLKIIENINKSLEERQNKYEESQKKGFWNKLFKK